MTDFMMQYGLVSLFIISFLAATLIPLGSEWFLILLLLNGIAPVPVVLIATLGNSFGSWTSYLIGRWGQDWIMSRILRISHEQKSRAETYFQRYGSWSLVLSWLPVIGDPLCLVSGLLRTPLTLFIPLVVTGKCIRYCFVAYVTLKSQQMLALI